MEKKSTGTTTMGIILKKLPRNPVIMAIGEKATIVVRTPNITGIATSWVPLIAAVNESEPRCMC